MNFSGRELITVNTAGVTLVLMLSLGCGKSLDDYIQKGNSLYSSDKFAEAELNYRKALQKDPKSGEAYYRLALVALKQNKSHQAYQALLQAVQVAPEHQAAKTELGNLALKSYVADPQHPKVLYDLLVRLSSEWLKKDPSSVDGLRIKGYLAMEERRPEEAVELFRRALRANPRQEKIILGLMDGLYRSKQAADAEKTGLDFIATDKTAGDVYDALYRLYRATDRPADAEGILVRKAKDNPQKPEYTLQLAAHYSGANKKQEMAAALQSFLSNPAAGPKVHLEAGDFYAAIGDWPHAVEQFKAGEALEVKDKYVYQNRIARALICQDKRDEALNILNVVVGQSPDDEESRALRAALLVQSTPTGNSALGVKEFESLVQKTPEDTFLRFVFARALVEKGNLAAARAQLIEVIKRRPNFLEAQISLAEIAYRERQMAQSVQYAGTALEQDPNSYRAQLIRGSALLRIGRLEEASAVLGRLARQDPKSVEVRLQLASLSLVGGRFAEAEAAFAKIRDSNPNELRAIEGLVDTDLAQHRYDKALGRLEAELKRMHGAPQLRYMMASAAMKAGRYGVAIETLRQLVAQSPGSIDPQLELANLFRLRGDLTNAINTLQKAALLQPKDQRPASMLAFLLDMSNRKQEAKLQCKRALAMQPDDPAIMNNLAYLMAETGDNLDDALRLAQQAVKKAPEQPSFTDTLGLVYLKRDQNDEALTIFNDLVRKLPNDPTVAYHTGLALYQKGYTARAKSEFVRALQGQPSKEIETSVTDLLSRL